MKTRAQLSSDLAQLAAALNSSRYTSGSTHNFYLYPSRFSPEITRTIIALFSQPGDSVLDPFMGGGTSIIEGMMLVSGCKPNWWYTGYQADWCDFAR